MIKRINVALILIIFLTTTIYAQVGGGLMFPGPGVGVGGFTVSNSGSWNGTNAAMNRTFAAPTSNKKWTYFAWFKFNVVNNYQYFLFSSGTGSTFNLRLNNNATIQLAIAGTLVYKTTNTFTTGVWYPLTFQFDSDNATQADRFIVYNCTTRLSTSTASVASGQTTSFNANGGVVYNGYDNGNDFAVYANWLEAETTFIDGAVQGPTSFVSSCNPKNQTGLTYGTNGFWLKYQNSGALGTDSSGNGNTWTNSNVTQSSTVPP